jgi:hypothetical protein
MADSQRHVPLQVQRYPVVLDVHGMPASTLRHLCRGRVLRAQRPASSIVSDLSSEEAAGKPPTAKQTFSCSLFSSSPRFNSVSVPFSAPNSFRLRPHRSSSSHSSLLRLSSHSVPLPLRPAAGLQPVANYATVSFSTPHSLAGFLDDATRICPSSSAPPVEGHFLSATVASLGFSLRPLF